MTGVTDEFWNGLWWLPDGAGNFLRNASIRECVTEIQRLRAALAAGPRIAGDVVAVALEAARAAWNTHERLDRWIALSELKEIVLPAIEAADDARGHAMVRWRKPEEYEVGDGSDFLARFRVTDTVFHEFTISLSRTEKLQDGVIAWAEMPTPPPWAETAPPVASTQAEATPVAQATGDVREASVAEPAPVFTKEMRELLRKTSAVSADLARRNAFTSSTHELDRLWNAAFPDPAP